MDEELRLVFVRSWFYLYVASELFPSIDSLLNSSTIVLLHLPLNILYDYGWFSRQLLSEQLLESFKTDTCGCILSLGCSYPFIFSFEVSLRIAFHHFSFEIYFIFEIL